MQQGFKIHKQAVLIEYNLNRIMKQVEQNKAADIAMIYDRPIQIIQEMLQQIKQGSYPLQARQAWVLEMIVERYRPYNGCVLTQLEEPVCLSLCADLQLFQEQWVR